MREFAHTRISPERIQVCHRRVREVTNVEVGGKKSDKSPLVNTS